MKSRNIFLKIILVLFLATDLFCESYSAQQLIPVNHWIYDALYTLNAESKSVSLADIGPCSVQELQLYFSKIDCEKLSQAGQDLYYQVQNYLSQKKFTLKLGPVDFGFNANLYPELLYKSNKNIDWTYGSHNQVTWNKKFYTYDENTKTWTLDKTEPVNSKYEDASFWGGNKLTTPLISFPFYLNFADIAFIETVPFISNNILYMVDPNNFTNVPLDFLAADFMQPTTANFSIGYLFKNDLGLAFQIGKEGLQIGRSLLGSVIYNNTFQTDAYFKFDFYSPKFRYNMDVVEVDHTKFAYLHNFEVHPLDWLKFGFTEGTLINDNFELRYLNPLMIMHSYHSWTEYETAFEDYVYGESHVSAYFGATFDIVPIKNLRIYGLYSQVEIQIPSELGSEYGRHLPTSLAGQLGVSYNFPSPWGGWITTGIEGLYSSPFMYYKTGPSWSWYRARYDNYKSTSNPICSWTGSPYGPDSAGFIIKGGYKNGQKWSVDLSYLFMAHGENTFNLFEETSDINGETYWVYYPSSYIDNQYSKSDTIARDMALTGNIEYKNQLTLDGRYVLNDHWAFDGQFVYTFVFNNNNILNDFEQGIQLALGVNFKVF